MTPFHQILANNAVANITNYTIWFALTFYVYIETRSVFATGMIAGFYLVLTAAFAIWFGSLVDHHRKKRVMLGSSGASLILYVVSFAIHSAAPEGAMRDVASPILWALISVVMLGVIAGNIRSIALPTLVTALIPEDRRDKANGLVGMVTGIGFLTTSVISGFLVAWGGMTATLLFGIVLTVAALAHLLTVRLEEPEPALDEHGKPPEKKIDLRGTAFLIGPLTQFVVIPFMTDGAGAAAIGDWFGRGPDRGIALVFTIAGALGIAMTLAAFNSRYYRQLSRAYQTPAAEAEA